MEKPDYHSFIYWGNEFIVLYEGQLEVRLSSDGMSLYMQGVGEFALLQYRSDGIHFQSVPNCLNHGSDPFFLGPSGLNQLAVINSYETGELFLCDLYSGEELVALEFNTP